MPIKLVGLNHPLQFAEEEVIAWVERQHAIHASFGNQGRKWLTLVRAGRELSKLWLNHRSPPAIRFSEIFEKRSETAAAFRLTSE